MERVRASRLRRAPGPRSSSSTRAAKPATSCRSRGTRRVRPRTPGRFPQEAKLGVYQVELRSGKQRGLASGTFRVEAFRVPHDDALVQPPKAPLVNPTEAQVDLLVAYLAGGGASFAPVKLRTQVQPRSVSSPDYPDFVFGGQDVQEGVTDRQAYSDVGCRGRGRGSRDTPRAAQPGKLTQVLPLQLDQNGTARATIDKLPRLAARRISSSRWSTRTRTARSSRSRRACRSGRRGSISGIRPRAGPRRRTGCGPGARARPRRASPPPNVEVAVDLFQRKIYSHRKRLIGGFYAYEDYSETKRDRRRLRGPHRTRSGLLFCELKPAAAGEVILVPAPATAPGTLPSRRARSTSSVPTAGGSSPATTTAWISSRRRSATSRARRARFQVRMPFREATVLVTVEREGVLEHHVVELAARSPVIEVPLKRQPRAQRLRLGAGGARAGRRRVPGPLRVSSGAVRTRSATGSARSTSVQVERDTRPTATGRPRQARVQARHGGDQGRLARRTSSRSKVTPERDDATRCARRRGSASQ